MSLVADDAYLHLEVVACTYDISNRHIILHFTVKAFDRFPTALRQRRTVPLWGKGEPIKDGFQTAFILKAQRHRK